MNDSIEVWRSVARSSGSYEVSNMGRVRSVAREVHHPAGGVSTKRGLILTPVFDSYGYLKCSVVQDGKRVVRKIHRLVAEAFLPPSDLPQVNHLDFDRTNNSPSNLEWVSNLDNMRHAFAAGRHSASKNPRKAKKLTIEKVVQIRAARAAGRLQKDIADEFGVHQSMVSNIVNDKRWLQGVPG